MNISAITKAIKKGNKSNTENSKWWNFDSGDER
jgi:hypothetical protein